MKRWLCCLLAVCLVVGSFAGVSRAATPQSYPLYNATPQLIAGAVENKIAEIYDLTGTRHTLNFPFSADAFASINDFKEQMGGVLHPLMTALFASDMKGRDHITVRTSYGMLTTAGVVKQYYYTVELTVHSSVPLREEMDRLEESVRGLTPTEQVKRLQRQLHQSIAYDEGTLDSSGTFLALVEKRAVCMGYSRAFMELCRRLDIPCIALVNDTHMWNAVYLEDRWQMLDVTWNLPLCDEITAAGHDYDVGVYRRAQYYYQNRYLNRGRAKSVQFSDLEKSWYNTAVEYALGRHLFYGVSETSFAPHEAMTRGMFVTVLGRLAGAAGQPCDFADVPQKAYYAGYVGWAKAAGIVSGVSDTRFAPEEQITREQLARLLVGFADYKMLSLREEEAVPFADDTAIARWAKEAVYRCRSAGLLSGKGHNEFDPAGQATRAEVATVLYNLCKNYW
ncbi:MAG: S-layer homology domain-containing protein [Clostridia bacterium]|nr:S-layer homology domain-containing protein [Clostridia bacterium]